MLELKQYSADDLPAALRQDIHDLMNMIWPPKTNPAKEAVLAVETSDASEDEEPDQQTFVILDDGKLIAHAGTFSRTIKYDGGEMEVMALEGVCVVPSRRGEGLGEKIVLATFEQVDSGRYPLSLFQTGVADFYRKLGCRTVANKFGNSLSSKPDQWPWWNDDIMIYPAAATWPDSPIDLNGPGY